MEDEQSRYTTTNGHQYVPNDRSKLLFPLVFCRECGQEYYCVNVTLDRETGLKVFTPRDPGDAIQNEESQEAGYLYLNSSHSSDPQ